MHQAVFLQGVQLAGLDFQRLQVLHGFGDGYLVDQDLSLAQRCLRDAVAGLDDAGRRGVGRHLHAGGALEKTADIDSVHGVVRALVNDFEHVARADDGRRNLDTARAPTVRQWHFARAKRHLVAGNRHGLQNGAADHALGALVQIRKVDVRVTHGCHPPGPGPRPCPGA